jgi:TonB-linked SusC/RagA family outer membrane protein
MNRIFTRILLHVVDKLVASACLLAFVASISPGAQAASRGNERIAITVSGVVKTVTGSPMPGVNILVKGTSIGTSSDKNGGFVIEVNGGDDVLVFSFIGFKPYETRVGSMTVIEVVLEEDIMSLSEVEIQSTGYWTDTKARSIGNIAKVSAKDIERQPVTSPLMSLQGRMTGVDVIPGNGAPGSAVRIQIRGQNSLRPEGNYPLYVIDGIPIDSRPISAAATSIIGNAGFDPLSTINPANIESIQVLKDADATSIYGSRGANGVILITTKQAKKSGETSFEVNAYQGVGSVSKFMDVLNTPQYLQMRREAFRNDGVEPQPWDYDLMQWDTTRNTDWQKELLGGTAKISDVQAGFTGGNVNTSFRLGGGFHRETLVFPGDFGYRRLSGSFNMNHLSPNQKLRITLAMNYGAEKNRLFDDSNMITNALTLPPNAPALYDENGDLNWEHSTFTNPLAATRNVHNTTTDNLVVNTDLLYNLISGLDVKVNLGYTSFTGNENVRFPLSAYDPAYAMYYTGTTRDGSNTRRTWIAEPQVNYNKRIGDSEFNVVVGGTWQEGRYASKMTSSGGYTSDLLLGSPQSATYTLVEKAETSQYKYVALYGRLGYNLKERYFLNFTGRRDGSSRYGPERRFANFGSVGAAWIFSGEPFLAGLSNVLNFGKLRASYGSTGTDQIGDYRYYELYTPTVGKYQGNISLYPTSPYLPDYHWEVTRKFELALETKMFDNRVAIEAAFYSNRSSNQLIETALPYASGFASVFANFSPTIENRGLEFMVETVNIRSEAFQWTTSVNVTIPRNELISFPNLESSAYAQMYVVGEPLSLTRLYALKGVDPQTGMYTFVDKDGGGSIDSQNDLVYTHNYGRKYYGGLTNTLSFKAFEFSFLLQFADQSAQNYTGFMPGQPANQPVDVLSRWRQVGDAANIQLYSQTLYGPIRDSFSQYTSSNAVIGNSSFLRLKTLSLTYTLPAAILRAARIQSARVYVQGQNLFTVTDYMGLDPETGSALPPLRMFTAGIQVKI